MPASHYYFSQKKKDLKSLLIINIFRNLFYFFPFKKDFGKKGIENRSESICLASKRSVIL
jgi:hypothetical protein